MKPLKCAQSGSERSSKYRKLNPAKVKQSTLKQKTKELKKRLESTEFDDEFKRKNRERQQRFLAKKRNALNLPTTTESVQSLSSTSETVQGLSSTSEMVQSLSSTSEMVQSLSSTSETVQGLSSTSEMVPVSYTHLTLPTKA